MQTKKEQIIAQLENIHKLQSNIEKRVLNAAFDAKDQDGTVLSEENINQRITLLSEQLIRDLPDANPVLISIMDGAMPFASRLNIALEKAGYQFQYASMQVSSYHGGTQSSGKVQIKADPKILLGGRTVILIDDVCDTGNTCKALKELFLLKGAKDIQLMVLVDKVQPRAEGANPDYSGFRMSKDDFIIGMGLDFDGGQRNLPFIKTVNMESLPTEEEQKLIDQLPQLNKALERCIAKSQQSISLAISKDSLFTPPAQIEEEKTTTANNNINLGL